MAWRPDEFGETILVRGRVIGRDARSRPIYGPSVEVNHCVIGPAGDQVVKDSGFVHGDITKLQVYAPPGTDVRGGDVVVIRGEDYVVQPRRDFDYGVGRRPAVRSHTPKVVFIVERGEVASDVT